MTGWYFFLLEGAEGHFDLHKEAWGKEIKKEEWGKEKITKKHEVKRRMRKRENNKEAWGKEKNEKKRK